MDKHGTIQFVKTPQGEAPEWAREAWVGVVVPYVGFGHSFPPLPFEIRNQIYSSMSKAHRNILLPRILHDSGFADNYYPDFSWEI
jgi:hypothetical protein